MSVAFEDRCPFFHALYLMIWPIISVVLGLIVGTIIGLATTFLVSVITLVRTPMHVAKMLYVTATTKECFKRCQYFDPLLRVAVFLLVPFVHVLWLVLVTAFSLTCGTLYYISKATKMFYVHEYMKHLSNLESNAKLKEGSKLREYITACQDFMEDDDKSFPAIYTLKILCAIVPGILLGVFPFVPFSLGVFLITIYRLPVNFYKSMKIALFTVVLKWDLKVAALSMLPFAHLLFPLVTFVTAMVSSIFYFLFATTKSIARGKSPFEKWYKIKEGLENYYAVHQEFIGKSDRYDHPTGIPSGWNGQSYGLPIQKILKWQWDFLVCCFLLLVGFPICLIGSVLIFGIKCIPGIIKSLVDFCTYLSEQSTAQILGCWTFYLLAFVLIPVGVVIANVLLIVVGTLLCSGIPSIYLRHGYVAGFHAPFAFLRQADRWEFYYEILVKFRVFRCLEGDYGTYLENLDNENPRTASNQNNHHDRKKNSEDYWDRFVSQCIRSTSVLLTRKWITLDNVQCMEPSAIQAIPAVAILEILVHTIRDSETHERDILWTIDGTLCKGKDCPQLDNVATFLLPKIMQAKRLLSEETRKKKNLCDTQNAKILTAMLCSNTDSTTHSLKEFVNTNKVGDSSQLNFVENNQVRAKLIELSLAILQVKPFQVRMKKIFDYGYVESGGTDELPLEQDEPATKTEAEPEVELEAEPKTKPEAEVAAGV